jgi:microsomal dipeptidase-like Zn-dependent dipeptidase
MTRDFFIDIHAHPTLRAYNASVTEGSRNLWEKTHNPTHDNKISRWARLKTREIARHSQANLYNYAQGNVRVVFDSLYPFEKGFLNLRKLPTAMLGRENAEMLLQSVTGYDGNQMSALRKNQNYFQELMGQYGFLSKGQGPSPDGQFSYQLAGNWNELQSIVNSDPNKIAVVVTIEGAHALNCGLPEKKGSKQATERELKENINTVKSWKAAPFFINLAHHFYNELTGHTRSLKPGLYQVLNQKKGLNEGITPLGWKVMHELLANDNGRRVLIDIKHMSIKARKEYYKMLESHNRLNPKDSIPVVCSHTGMSAYKTIKASARRKDKPRKMRKSTFNNWAINLSDEEVKIISSTGGLIGVMVDKGLLASQVKLQEIKDLQDFNGQKDALLHLVAQNIFQMVHAVGDKRGWDLMALGTDYDGLITHIDMYPEAACLPDLRVDLVDYLKRTRYAHELWYGYEPEEMVQKLMQTNAMNFLENHF